MLRTSVSRICVSLLLWGALGGALPTSQVPLVDRKTNFFNRTVSTELFYELEELARIVDISYCVGTTGIQKPFICASRCQDFDGFELVTVRSRAIIITRLLLMFDCRLGIRDRYSLIHADILPYPISAHARALLSHFEVHTLSQIL